VRYDKIFSYAIERLHDGAPGIASLPSLALAAATTKGDLLS